MKVYIEQMFESVTRVRSSSSLLLLFGGGCTSGGHFRMVAGGNGGVRGDVLWMGE